MFFITMLIILGITLFAGLILAIVEKVTNKTYDIAEAVIGAPLVMSFFLALYCLC